jgi:hypothetical protein
VRIWKRDENKIIKDFASRPASPEARDYWDSIWQCLREKLGSEGHELLSGIEREWMRLLREMFRALHGVTESDRANFRDLLAIYRRNWRANTIDDQSQADAIINLRDMLSTICGASWWADFERLVETMRDRLGHAVSCFDPDRLAKLDPTFAAFIPNAASRMRSSSYRQSKGA